MQEILLTLSGKSPASGSGGINLGIAKRAAGHRVNNNASFRCKLFIKFLVEVLFENHYNKKQGKQMTDLRTIMEQYVDIDLQQIIISGAKTKEGPSKIRIRPVLLRGILKYQCTKTVGAKELHDNHDKKEIMAIICEAMESRFKQLQLQHGQASVSVLVSKKGKMTIKRRAGEGVIDEKRDLSHNRRKQYILAPDRKVGFLIDLGVMSQEGKIIQSRYDKFRQINRFLEFIEDILWKLPKDREVSIVDFGCGKSYLTFAMYHYLRELRGYDVRILGLDLKKDVIEHCNALSKKYGYEKLHFHQGDIADCDFISQVDMVVSLHACDTATDYALDKAVGWGAAVILSVPCCQHELNGQIENETLRPVLSYGILKERMAALLTDGLRAQMLECAGYETQILEFVDMEHTPKNLLIRAVKTEGKKGDSKELKECMEFFHVTPLLDTLLNKRETGEDEEKFN